MTKVRWGLLSTANINKRLIPAIRASARGELVAVASRRQAAADAYACLLYTSDAADERSSGGLGGRTTIKKTNKKTSAET